MDLEVEQQRGRRSVVDSQSDAYSLLDLSRCGAILVEKLEAKFESVGWLCTLCTSISA